MKKLLFITLILIISIVLALDGNLSARRVKDVGSPVAYRLELSLVRALIDLQDRAFKYGYTDREKVDLFKEYLPSESSFYKALVELSDRMYEELDWEEMSVEERGSVVSKLCENYNLNVVQRDMLEWLVGLVNSEIREDFFNWLNSYEDVLELTIDKVVKQINNMAAPQARYILSDYDKAILYFYYLASKGELPGWSSDLVRILRFENWNKLGKLSKELIIGGSLRERACAFLLMRENISESDLGTIKDLVENEDPSKIVEIQDSVLRGEIEFLSQRKIIPSDAPLIKEVLKLFNYKDAKQYFLSKFTVSNDTKISEAVGKIYGKKSILKNYNLSPIENLKLFLETMQDKIPAEDREWIKRIIERGEREQRNDLLQMEKDFDFLYESVNSSRFTLTSSLSEFKRKVEDLRRKIENCSISTEARQDREGIKTMFLDLVEKLSRMDKIAITAIRSQSNVITKYDAEIRDLLDEIERDIEQWEEYFRELGGGIDNLDLTPGVPHYLTPEQKVRMFEKILAMYSPQSAEQVPKVYEAMRNNEDLTEFLVPIVNVIKELLRPYKEIDYIQDNTTRKAVQDLLGIGEKPTLRRYEYRREGGLEDIKVIWGYYDEGVFIKGPFRQMIERYLGGIDLVDDQRRQDRKKAEALAKRALEILASEIPYLNDKAKRPKDWRYATRFIFGLQPPENFGVRQVIVAADDIDAQIGEGEESLTRLVRSGTALFPDIAPIVVIGDRLLDKVVKNPDAYKDKPGLIDFKDLNHDEITKYLPQGSIVVYVPSALSNREDEILKVSYEAMKQLHIDGDIYYLQLVDAKRAGLVLPDVPNASLISWLRAVVEREGGKQRKGVSVKFGGKEILRIYSVSQVKNIVSGKINPDDVITDENVETSLSVEVRNRSEYERLVERWKEEIKGLMVSKGVRLLPGVEIEFHLEDTATFKLSDIPKLFGSNVVLGGKIILDPLTHIGSNTELENCDVRRTWIVDNPVTKHTVIRNAKVLDSSIGPGVIIEGNEEAEVEIADSYIGEDMRIPAQIAGRPARIVKSIILNPVDLSRVVQLSGTQSYNPKQNVWDELQDRYAIEVADEIYSELESRAPKKLEAAALKLATLFGSNEGAQRIYAGEILLTLRLRDENLYNELMDKIFIISGFIYPPHGVNPNEYYNALQATIDARNTIGVIATVIELGGVRGIERDRNGNIVSRPDLITLESEIAELLSRIPQDPAEEENIRMLVPDLEHYVAGTVPHGRAKRMLLWYSYRDYVAYEVAKNELRELGIAEALARRGYRTPEAQARIRMSEATQDKEIMRFVEREADDYAMRNLDKFNQVIDWAMGYAFLEKAPDPLAPWMGRYLRDNLGNTQLIMVGRNLMRALLTGEFTTEISEYDPMKSANLTADMAAMDEMAASKENGEFDAAVEKLLQEERFQHYRESHGEERARALAALLVRVKEAIGSGIVDLNNPDIRAGWQKRGIAYVVERYNEARNKEFRIDMWDKFVEEVVDNPEMVAISFFPDNHGEAMYDLKFIEQLIKYREEYIGHGKTKVYFIPKGSRGISNDFSYQAAYQVVYGEKASTYDFRSDGETHTMRGDDEFYYKGYEQFFKKLREYAEAGLFEIVQNGPLIQGFSLRHMTPEVAEALEKSDVVILKGQANFEMSQGLNKVHYNWFIVKGFTNQVSTGLDNRPKPFVLARIEPVLAPFGNYAPQGEREILVYWRLPNYYLRLYHRGILPVEALYINPERKYGKAQANFLVLDEYLKAIYEIEVVQEDKEVRFKGYTPEYSFLKEKFGGEKGLEQLNRWIVEEANLPGGRNLYGIIQDPCLKGIVENENYRDVFLNNDNITSDNLMKLMYFNSLYRARSGRNLDIVRLNQQLEAVNNIMDSYENLREIMEKYDEILEKLRGVIGDEV